MRAAIIGIGTALPEGRIEQQAAARLAEGFGCRNDADRRLLQVLYRRTGVKRRGSVLLEPGEGEVVAPSFFPAPSEPGDRGPGTGARMARYVQEAPRLAVAAARRAMEAAGLAGADIGQVLTVSCTGFFAPGMDVTLIRSLGLPPTTGRTHIGFMGCHGALNALRVAVPLAGSEGGRAALVCAVELCSLHFQYGWDPDQVVANALFADGAAAAVVAPAEDRGWPVRGSRSWLLPDSGEAMTWRIGDHGFEMTLSARVPDLIREHLRPGLDHWLREHGLGVEDVRTWAIHPGGPRIVSQVAETLGLAPEATAVSRQVLAECGNMSSPTILFILERLMRAGAQRPCVALGFGPGLTAEAALFG